MLVELGQLLLAFLLLGVGEPHPRHGRRGHLLVVVHHVVQGQDVRGGLLLVKLLLRWYSFTYTKRGGQLALGWGCSARLPKPNEALTVAPAIELVLQPCDGVAQGLVLFLLPLILLLPLLCGQLHVDAHGVLDGLRSETPENLTGNWQFKAADESRNVATKCNADRLTTKGMF